MEAYTQFAHEKIVEEFRHVMKTSTEKLSTSSITAMLEKILASDLVSKKLFSAFEDTKPIVVVASETKRKASPNWITMWNSLKVGGAAKFPEDFKKIKESLPPKTSHFTIMKTLRDMKEKDGGWKVWWEEKMRTGTLGVDVPKEPPKSRKSKETTIDTKSSVSATDSEVEPNIPEDDEMDADKSK